MTESWSSQPFVPFQSNKQTPQTRIKVTQTRNPKTCNLPSKQNHETPSSNQTEPRKMKGMNISSFRTQARVSLYHVLAPNYFTTCCCASCCAI